MTTPIHNNANPVAPLYTPDVPIDTDWDQLITLLRLQGSNSWCPGYSDGEFNSSEIVALNFAKPHETYFQLLLHDDKDNAQDGDYMQSSYLAMR